MYRNKGNPRIRSSRNHQRPASLDDSAPPLVPLVNSMQHHTNPNGGIPAFACDPRREKPELSGAMQEKLPRRLVRPMRFLKKNDVVLFD